MTAIVLVSGGDARVGLAQGAQGVGEAVPADGVDDDVDAPLADRREEPVRPLPRMPFAALAAAVMLFASAWTASENASRAAFEAI